ncbi:MAG: AAA family ATPase [Clostridium sp.]|nr:AAA family ATPase [Clostridium sp.]MCM1444011.1 AAA family ATPase [Candidatus Amulumruptor caecigallinarius]
MYLKKIIAHGFKSFADKIVIDMNDGINGIVGPNGSGKSNVVDAVRWVLGEQSIKSLRGDSNMTDVIFSGSKSRNISNVASVSLIFDNTDSYLPIPYSEVSIKRRVYRDGTNEYYLNNEKCRLKDIQNILLDSGMEKESFNIISQGKIEEIISSKPEDRRIIIEEAASVLKYKKRKEESLRKLDKTHLNMSRVNDIISELEKTVEPLKEQKDKALEYISVKDELTDIEIALITHDITNMNYKYQEKKAIIEKLNQELIEFNSKASTNDANIEENKLKLTKVEEKIKETQSDLIKITAEVEKINGQKNIILERKKYEVDDIKLHNNILELKESLLKIDNEINSTKTILNTKEQELNKNLENSIYQEKIINDIKTNKNKIQIELSNKIKEENHIQNKVERLKQNIENNGIIPNSINSILNNIKLKGIHNIVGNLINVDEKYSNAIQISLGFSINNIVVDNELSAKEAINYLKKEKLGRATFLPLNVMKSKSLDSTILNLIDGENIISTADKLITYDLKYKNIIENLLGNVIVCKNLDIANNLSKKINYRYKIVTIDGELIHVGGSVTGGQVQTQSNIISIKYEYENTLKELKKIEESATKLEENINLLDKNIQIELDKLYIINKNKINIENQIAELKTKLSDLLLKKETCNQELTGTNNLVNNSISNEEEEILNLLYKTQNEKNEIEVKLNTLNNEKYELNDKIEQIEYQFKKENLCLNQKNNELKEAEIEVNRLDVKLDNLLNTLSETYNMTYEKAITLYKLELDTETARNKVNMLKRKLKEIGEVNLTAPEEYENVSKRYEFLIEQRNDLVNAENTLLEIINEMDSVMKKEFLSSFKIINENFKQTFKELFKGGTASLKLLDENNLLETGIEIIASPPGKKLTSITLLSGGEKTLTSISLLFAILKSRPVPFCILDEVEAALDEVNVDSFGNYLKSLKDKTQFILITHKKKTMEYADLLYGITMQESGVSKLVSVRLEEIS